MNTLNIENKEYVVISRKEYEDLRTKAAIKTVSSKKLSLADGKKMAYKLIDKWEKGNKQHPGKLVGCEIAEQFPHLLSAREDIDIYFPNLYSKSIIFLDKK